MSRKKATIVLIALVGSLILGANNAWSRWPKRSKAVTPLNLPHADEFKPEEIARKAKEEAEKRLADERERVRQAKEEKERAAAAAKAAAEKKRKEAAKAAKDKLEEEERRAKDIADAAKREEAESKQEIEKLTLAIKEFDMLPEKLKDEATKFDEWHHKLLETYAGVLKQSSESTLKDLAEKTRAIPGLDKFIENQAVISGLMERPTFIEFGNDGGEPVYYVNGMFTPQRHTNENNEEDGAFAEAQTLAEVLKRPVRLIYNEGFSSDDPRSVDDIEEAIKDRIWPYKIENELTSPTATTFIQSVQNGKLNLQHNPTTRQIAYLLYHTDKPISIVGYSQGCLIIRNACHTLAILNKTGTVPDKIRWAAAGLPLNDNEIWPRPSKFSPLMERDDPVAKLCGVRGGGEKAWQCNRAHHSWFKYYVVKITPEMLW